MTPESAGSPLDLLIVGGQAGCAGAAPRRARPLTQPLLGAGVGSPPGCDLRARIKSELVEDMPDMTLGCSWGDDETGCDLFVAESLGD